MYQVLTELINEKTLIAGFAHPFYCFNFPRKVQIFRNIQQMLITEINYDCKFNKLKKRTYYSPMLAIQ